MSPVHLLPRYVRIVGPRPGPRSKGPSEPAGQTTAPVASDPHDGTASQARGSAEAGMFEQETSVAIRQGVTQGSSGRTTTSVSRLAGCVMEIESSEAMYGVMNG